MSVTNCLDCACREKRMRELVVRVAELEEALKNAVETLLRINSIRGGFHEYDDSTPYGRGLGDGQKVSADYAKNCLAAIAPEALSRTPGDALTRLQALEKVAEAARIASHEIQTQHVCWPEEVDDLADALEALDSEKGER